VHACVQDDTKDSPAKKPPQHQSGVVGDVPNQQLILQVWRRAGAWSLSYPAEAAPKAAPCVTAQWGIVSTNYDHKLQRCSCRMTLICGAATDRAQARGRQPWRPVKVSELAAHRGAATCRKQELASDTGARAAPLAADASSEAEPAAWLNAGPRREFWCTLRSAAARANAVIITATDGWCHATGQRTHPHIFRCPPLDLDAQSCAGPAQ